MADVLAAKARTGSAKKPVVSYHVERYDVREIMLNIYPKKGITEHEIMEQIHKRHEQRRIQKSQKDST